MSALRLLNQTNITSSVSTVSVTDVFSADFEIYKIVTEGLSTAGTDQTDPNFRFINASGTVVDQSNYDYAHQIMRMDSSFTEQRPTNQAQLYRFFGEGSDQAPETANSVGYVFSPFNSSRYTFAIYQSSNSAAGLDLPMKGIGVLKQTASMTGFQVIDGNGSRPFASGTIKTYGLAVS